MKLSGTLAAFLLFILIAAQAYSQSWQGGPDEGITESFRWRSIGPGNMMGRISALDAPLTMTIK